MCFTLFRCKTFSFLSKLSRLASWEDVTKQRLSVFKVSVTRKTMKRSPAWESLLPSLHSVFSLQLKDKNSSHSHMSLLPERFVSYSGHPARIIQSCSPNLILMKYCEKYHPHSLCMCGSRVPLGGWLALSRQGCCNHRNIICLDFPFGRLCLHLF